jgi:hypothetical protein
LRSPELPVIAKTFGIAKTFRSQRANFLHHAKRLRDHGDAPSRRMRSDVTTSALINHGSHWLSDIDSWHPDYYAQLPGGLNPGRSVESDFVDAFSPASCFGKTDPSAAAPALRSIAIARRPLQD